MRFLIAIFFLSVFITKLPAQCSVGDLLSPVLVDSVTVDAAGNVTICWKASPEPDIAWYYIFHINQITAANDVIDSVAGGGPVCFTITAANNNSTTVSEEYAIGVKDLCDNEMLTVLDYHNTIFLDNTVDVCSGKISLNWTPYNDFNSGLNVSYNIYASENGAPYDFVGSTTSTNYNYTTVNAGSIYDFYVMSIENGGVGPFSSSSNVINVNTNFFMQDPNYLYLYATTVVDSQHATIQFYADTAADIKEYEVKRASSAAGPYSTIAYLPASSDMDPMVTYNSSAETNHQQYFYKVSAVNLCNISTFTSNIGNTIFLTATSNNNLEGLVTLTFTAYQNWQGGVMNYEIYRAVGGFWESSPIATIPPFSGSTTYIDDVSGILTGNGEFCYKVIANENPVAHVDNLPEATSTSNEECVEYEPIIFIPNAFIPTGEHNTIFKPVLSYAEPSAYSLSIFNRWGKKIFETDNIDEGWNGKINNSGNMCPVGTYVYLVKFQSVIEETFRKRGTLALIR